MKAIKICYAVLLVIYFAQHTANAQKPKTIENNTLYTAGHASAFIGGLYTAFYPYGKLKQHGDFGLGAPDKLDGELMILNGKIYQTQASGKTFEVSPEGATPFSVVNFFKANKVLKVTAKMSKEKLYAYLDSVLPNQNGIYAIHIKGRFKEIKTRAFPKVTQQPYLPLAQMLNLQHFFSFKEATGDLIGYRIPAYMDGPNITGYHFHFLSADKKNGGHLIEVLTDNVIIEIDYLDSFTVNIPQTKDFMSFDFKKDRRDEVKQVENGKKN
jgi:acetolactate decarboxylase